jgi:hypothetical protein
MIMGMEDIQRSMRRHHHSLDKFTRRAHASLGIGSIPSVSPVRRQRTRPEENILQGEIRKIKPLNFNGEHRKREEAKAWLLEMKKYFQQHDYPYWELAHFWEKANFGEQSANKENTVGKKSNMCRVKSMQRRKACEAHIK